MILHKSMVLLTYCFFQAHYFLFQKFPLFCSWKSYGFNILHCSYYLHSFDFHCATTAIQNLLLYLFIKGIIKLTSNYRGISWLPTTGEIIQDHQCGFWCNRWSTDHIFCIHQILEKKCKYKWDSFRSICLQRC